MPTTLIIRHQGEENGQPQFVVARLSDGKTTEAVSLDPPDKITLPNRGNSYLVNDLRWYLVLRSHVKFERDKDGKWQLTIEHKPVADGLLNKLIKKTEALLA